MASTSHNLTPSSSTLTSPSTLWDVFLSFRGIDTRYTFTDHLYKALHRTGIRAFMDNPELRSGEVISDSLVQAIHESKTYIVVLSENYASSSWCLDELAEILGCFKRMKRLVVPVFYNIDPSVVRHQTGSFKEGLEKHQTRFAMEKVNKWRLTLSEVADFSGYHISTNRHQIQSFKEAFEKHQTRFETEKVEKWRLALNEVADFSGYHVSTNRSQADIIDEIVDRISLEINPKTLYVAKYPVGLDSHVKDITALLNSNTEGVIRIGIHGMGGVGKTTLAKAVYNQNYQRFQGSCFLANVGEVSRTENGLVGLQHQLIVDVLKCNNLNFGNKDQGIELIRAKLCSKKVLLVVDDLDNLKPLEYLEGLFALGSMILITTRNEDLLDSIKVQAKYKVNELADDQSRKLFAQHAFGDYKIPDKFTGLTKEILKCAGGLPLALTVFGSNLLNQPEEEWRWFIDKLKRVPVDDIEKKLLISFDALKLIDPMLQNIFLDIACFYIGRGKKEVVRIFETFYTFVNRNIDSLTKRCLLTINESGILGMHDLLRDMGRKIAFNNSPDEPGKHSRLWVSDDINTVLKNDEGTEAIQGIIRGYHHSGKMEGVTFVAKSFKKMSKLKFLYLNNVNLTGSFKKTFKDLRWLCWKFCPLECLPSEFYAEKLVILELPCSNIRTTWEPPREFKKLKTLNMSGSQKLETTPNFIRLPCLETLNLEDCDSLEEVHVSIGSLVSLVHLNLGNCSNLKSLPDSICSLRALEVLIITNCTRLEALPTELGSIESLKTLNARGLTVPKLPDSIGHLCNLVNLFLSDNINLETLPDSICNLRSLEILDISYCMRLEELPDQLGMITSLKKLILVGTSMLRMLPDISKLSNIKYLNLVGCSNLLSISELPANLERIKADGVETLDLCSLKHLKELNLQNCRYLTEIQGLEELTSLNDLNLRRCSSMERLPNLSNLKHMERLNLENCASLTEVIGLEELTSLKDLNFCFCGNLLSVSGFPPNQKWVDAEGCTSLKRLPDLSSLKQLVGLDLTNCEAFKEIRGLEEVTSLEYLTFSNCMSMERLPNLCNVKNLKELNLSYCNSLTEIIGLEKVASLEDLEFAYCGNLLSVSKLPPNLKWLEAQGCTSLKKLPNLSNLKQLKRVDLTSCEALKEIEGLEEVTSLEFLTLSDCRCMERFSNLSNLKHLKILDLANCKALKEIQGLEEVTSLEFLTLSNCRCIERLPNLSNLKHLKRLDLTNCEALKEIQGLEEVTSLGFLTLSNCRSMEILPNLANLKHLQRLDLEYCAILTEVLGLEDLTSLENLQFRCCGNLLSVSKLPPNLKWVDAEGCTSLKRLPNLSNLKQLEELDLTNCSGLTEIQGLEQLTCLRELYLSGCNSSFLAHIHKSFF